MKNFYDILLILCSFGFVYGWTRQRTKQKVLAYGITVVVFTVLILLRENS